MASAASTSWCVAVAHGSAFGNDGAFIEMVAGWHAQIGKAVLENWQFAAEMAEAIGDQLEYERRWRHDPDLTDVLTASIVLADVLKSPAPRNISHRDGGNQRLPNHRSERTGLRRNPHPR